MGLLSKLFKPADTQEPEEMEIVLDGRAKPAGPAIVRGVDKRRHPRIVQTTAGGVRGKPRFWVFGGKDCYEDAEGGAETLSFDVAKEIAAMPRPDLEGKVELPRYRALREKASA